VSPSNEAEEMQGPRMRERVHADQEDSDLLLEALQEPGGATSAYQNGPEGQRVAESMMRINLIRSADREWMASGLPLFRDALQVLCKVGRMCGLAPAHLTSCSGPSLRRSSLRATSATPRWLPCRRRWPPALNSSARRPRQRLGNPP